MKNIILSFIAFILSFGLTFFGLNKYIPKTSSANFDIIKEEIITENTNDVVEEETENFNEDNQANEDDSQELTEKIVEKPVTQYTLKVNVDDITKDYKTWKKYNKQNIELSSNFIPINVDNVEIEKEDFLTELKTGLYIPIEVKEDFIGYKLIELKDDKTSRRIGKSERGVASVAYDYFKKEGTKLPQFDWEDLEGNTYSSSSTKGKIKVIKCWFVNCVVCVQEFPELNELYDRYEGNDQIQFLSLAFDKSDKLKNFLSKKEFRFPVIPEQRKYMGKSLELRQYPTHVIVDEDNNIIKMVSNVKALVSVVDQLLGDAKFDEGEEEEIETEF